MIYILFVLVAFLLLVIWGVNGKEVFSVSFIITAGFLLLIGVAITSMKFYGVEDISFETTLVVFGSLIFAVLGENIGKKIKIENDVIDKRRYVEEDYYPDEINIKLFPQVILIGICIAALLLSYRNFGGIASAHGIGGDFIAIYTRMRNSLIVGNFTLQRSTLLTQLCSASNCIMYFMYYSFVRNAIYYRKRCYMQLLPIIPCIIISLLTTARTGLINIVIVLTFITIILYKQKYGWNRKGSTKILRIIIIAFAMLVLGFRLSGLLTGKTGSVGLIENIYVYFSNSLFTLDTQINNGIQRSELFGRETLKYFYQVFNMLGAHFDLGSDFFAPVRFGTSGSDNIFTGLYKPLIDFGVVGTFFTRFLIGMVYAHIIRRIKSMKSGENFIAVLFSAIIMYPIVMQPIADVFISITNIGLAYTLIYCYILDRVFIKRTIRFVARKS